MRIWTGCRPPACPLHQPYHPPASLRLPEITNHSSRICGHHRIAATATTATNATSATNATTAATATGYLLGSNNLSDISSKQTSQQNLQGSAALTITSGTATLSLAAAYQTLALNSTGGSVVIAKPAGTPFAGQKIHLESTQGATGSAYLTANYSSAQFLFITLSANVTNTAAMTFPYVGTYFLEVLPGSGAYSITTWTSPVVVPAAGAPTPSTTTGHYTIYSLYWDGSNAFLSGIGY